MKIRQLISIEENGLVVGWDAYVEMESEGQTLIFINRVSGNNKPYSQQTELDMQSVREAALIFPGAVSPKFVQEYEIPIVLNPPPGA